MGNSTDYIFGKDTVVSRKKRRRSLILCMIFGILVLIPILVLAFLGFFDKDSTTPGELTKVGNGMNGDEDVSVACIFQMLF